MTNITLQKKRNELAPMMGMMVGMMLLGIMAETTAAKPSTTTLTGVVSDPKAKKFVDGATVALDSATMTTDIVGSYTFAGLSPGNYTLAVSKTGYETKTMQIAIVQGANRVDIALAPVVQVGKASLTGIVYDYDISVPIANAAVKLGVLETTTDTNGGYIFENVDPGTYHLTVSIEGYYDYSDYLTLLAGDNTWDIFLVTLSGARFEVNDLTIAPSEAYVNQLVEISATVTSTGDTPGSCVVNCSITPPSGQPSTMSQNITLNPAQSQKVVFDITPTEVGVYQVTLGGLSASFTTRVPLAELALTITDTGIPLADASVVLGGITQQTDSLGKCSFADIPEGDYMITITNKDGYKAYEDTVSFHVPRSSPTPPPPPV